MLQYQQAATDLNHTRPALSTLASIASDHSSHLRTYNNGNHIMMTYATSSPAATTGGGQGNNNIPPVCQNCATSTTPLWRRDEIGSVLCNACGLFLKLHGTPRPISLKTDVIKSRHRVKTASQALKKRSLFEGNDISALTARTEAGTPPSNHPNNHRRPSQKTSSSRGSERSYSPVSRSDTPTIRHPSNNIAPQHLFDGISMPPEHNFQPSPSIPPLNLRQPSPSSLEPPQTYDSLLQSTTALKTRVSELEVINDLFRGRVTQLEQTEEKSRRNELMQRQTEKNLRQLLEESQVREMDLQRRISDLQRELADFRGGTSSGNNGGGAGGEEQQQSRSAKRQRMSDDYNHNSNNSSNNNTMLPRGMASLVDIVGVGGLVSSSTSSPSMYSTTATNGGMQQQQQQQRLSLDGNDYGGGRASDGHHEYGHQLHLPRVSDGNEYTNLPVISTT